jgi:predicted nuclease of predicted toxin-antitoxin system
VKFLVDAQLPPALTTWIEDRGHQASHIVDLGGVGVSDATIWDIARREGRIIVTKDRDFAIWASARRNGPQVVWVRLGNATRQNLLDWLEPRWPEIEARLREQIHLIEVGRP